MIIANSSPLIALGHLDRLDIFEGLFGKIYIPQQVYQETVVETVVENQRQAILQSIRENIIIISNATTEYSFKRKLHRGEKGVLNLAVEKKAKGIILDDKRARKEANDIGLQFALIYTTDVLKAAENRGLITSYLDIMKQLRKMNIYLPE